MLKLWPARAAVPILIAVLLSGCGGGGGGGGGSGGGTTTPAASPALSFTPATASGTVVAGATLTMNVVGAVARPTDFTNATVYPSIVDSNGVLLSSSQLVRDSDSQYHAVLQTLPTLAAGSYSGNFSLRLCRDSGCASQFPGSPVTLPYNFTVLPAGSGVFTVVPAAALSATGQSGVNTPASVSVAITTTGRSWTASNGGAAWLTLSPASGTGDGSLTASYNLTGLATGTYTTNLTVTTSDSNTVSLPVSLTVLPPGLVLGSNSVTFNAINGAPIATQVISLDTDTKTATSYTASSSATWLTVSPTSGTTPATTVLTVDPTVGTLASGTYSGNIVLTPSGLATRTLPVTLNLSAATLQPSLSSITLGGTYGRDFSSSQALSLTLNTSTNSWPWALSNVPAWASFSSSAGSVNAAGASTSVKAVPASASTGITSQLVGAKAAVNGDTVSSSVLLTINKDQHKLLPAETAVAFVNTPSWSRLTRTISVTDNYSNFGGMSATSDASWLVVGVSSNTLILTADPTQLSTDTLYTATITITPSDSDVTAPETIRVALWNGAATPTAAATTKVSLPYTNVVTDPARPYAYAHNGSAYVDVYNVYTGAKVASITGFSATLGDMAVAPNGSTLYVLDIDNSRVTAVNLSTLAISNQLSLASAGTKATRLKVIRPNGVGMLLLSDGQAYLTSSYARLSNLPLSTGGTLAASADGKRVVQQDEGGSSVTHTSVSVDYAALNGGTLFAAKLTAASHSSPGTLGQDVWVNSDGSSVIYAASTPKSCTMMNGTSLGIVSYLNVGELAPNNVDVAIDGRIVCAGATKTGANDLYLFSSSGTLVQQYRVAASGQQLLARQVALSGDGWIAAVISDDSVLNFLAIGP